MSAHISKMKTMDNSPTDQYWHRENDTIKTVFFALMIFNAFCIPFAAIFIKNEMTMWILFAIMWAVSIS